MTDAPDYAIVDAQLRADEAGIAPAELHGVLCARLSACGRAELGDWLSTALGERTEPDALPGALRELLDELLRWTVAGFEREDFGFRLFLPADDVSLAQRTDALAGWCAGFLGGLGASGVEAPEALPEEAGEFVRDLSELSRARIDAAGDPEEEEQAFFELLEYTRVGAMLLFETLRGPEAGEALH